MSRTRDIRLATIAGLILIGTLLLGAQPGIAAPPDPVNPTEIAPPPATTTTTTTTNPRPDVDLPATDIVIAPPTTDPSAPTTPTETTEPTQPTPSRTARPARPKPPTTPTTTTTPAGIPTPNRIDTGTGGSAVPGAPTWLFWVVPLLAVLTLAAGVSGYWMARSEQDRR
ncbi:MAG TPA: hypothetical protein VGX25_23425 [Actinophytocola sp.]|uniref:hypothetical protein n=1 Tax=Actinophytocola sp. TaxID=1872138 RepID=UPI002DDCFC15|nr:hypothetical protein [Actinophytocola sp.]HEV2782354.1 hypothetical protein [Actinophytocola sp.]